MTRVTETIGLDWAVKDYDKEAMDKLLSEAQEAAEKALLEERAKFNKWCESVVRTNATPPIKGEITKGKIRWRGIKKREVSGYYFNRTEIWQRDKCIGTYTVEYDYESPLKEKIYGTIKNTFGGC